MFFFRLLFTLLTFLFFFPLPGLEPPRLCLFEFDAMGNKIGLRIFRTVLFLLGDIRTDLGAPIEFIAFWTAARISASSPENSRYIFLDSPSSLRRYHKLISCLATEVFDLFFLYIFLELFLETTEPWLKKHTQECWEVTVAVRQALSTFRERFLFEKKSLKTNQAPPICYTCFKEKITCIQRFQ